MRWHFIVLLIIAGIGGALQPAINARLGAVIGELEASLVNFAGGVIFIVPIILLFGKGNLARLIGLPWYYLIGGILGALIVLSFIYGVPTFGVTFSISLMMTAEMITALFADKYGFMGAPPTPITWVRIVGVLLMIAGTRLVLR